MNRLLQLQLKKIYGKDFESQEFSQEFQGFLELVERSYKDFEKESQLLEKTLETHSEELTQSNKEIVLQHNLLKSVSNSVSDIIFYKDLNLKYIGCNKNFENVVGKVESEIIGKEDSELFEEEHARLFSNMDKDVLEKSEAETYSEWIEFPDSQKLLLSTLKSPLFDIKGKKIGLVAVSRDITNEYELQKELEKQNALMVHQSRFASMGEMIANIAHQWRQPLNALGLLLQNLELAYEKNMINEEFIHRVINKGNYLTSSMSQTIDDFRNFFQPKSTVEIFKVSSSLNSIVEMLNPSFKSKNISIEQDVDKSTCVTGSSNEFAHVILNILNNAKDALLENGVDEKKINIAVFKNKGLVQIEITDNAGGIKDEILDKVFDPYFTTKDEGQGTGIGLYMSKSIIENNMNGSLNVQNIQNGAKFVIRLKLEECPNEF